MWDCTSPARSRRPISERREQLITTAPQTAIDRSDRHVRAGGQPCPITLHADGLRGCHPTPACGRHSTGQTFLDTALVAGDGQYLVEEGLEDLLLQLGRIAEMDAIGTQPLACCAVAVGAQPI